MASPRLQHVSTPIPAGSQEQVRAFYGGVLGLPEKPIPPSLRGGNLVWFVAGEGEGQMELHFIPDPILPHPQSQQHFCLVVADLEAYRKRLSEAGYAVIEAQPIPTRPRFFCRDPLGNLVEFTTIFGDYRDEL